jgi:hypothetical protein
MQITNAAAAPASLNAVDVVRVGVPGESHASQEVDVCLFARLIATTSDIVERKAICR